MQLHSDHTRVQFAGFPGIGMKRLLPKLTARLHPYKEGARLLEVPPFVSEIPSSMDSAITHEWLWPRVGKFFKPKDIIIAETGEHCLCQSIFGSTLRGTLICMVMVIL